MWKLAEMFVSLSVDDKGLDHGLGKAHATVRTAGRDMEASFAAAGRRAGEGFARDAIGRLRDQRGRFVAQGRDLGREVERGLGGGLGGGLGKALSGFRGAFGGTGGLLLGLGAGAGALGVAHGLYEAATAAADLDESVSKTKQTFGGSFGTVDRTVNDLADKFGIVKTEAYDAAANLGLIGQAAGLTKAQSAGLASQFTRLADDASSFFNVPMAEALQRLQSGLVGEAEPMRRFGVLLSEDAVKAEALRLGLAKTSKELTDQTKVMARASLIVRGMTAVVGDHERTQDSATNQMRKFSGELENLKADFGKNLTGPLTDALKLTREMTMAMSRLTGQNVGSAGEAVGGLLGGAVGAARNLNAAGVDAMESARRNNPNGLGSYLAPLAGYAAGVARHVLSPDQALADRLAGVQTGLPAARAGAERDRAEQRYVEVIRRASLARAEAEAVERRARERAAEGKPGGFEFGANAVRNLLGLPAPPRFVGPPRPEGGLQGPSLYDSMMAEDRARAMGPTRAELESGRARDRAAKAAETRDRMNANLRRMGLPPLPEPRPAAGPDAAADGWGVAPARSVPSGKLLEMWDRPRPPASLIGGAVAGVRAVVENSKLGRESSAAQEKTAANTGELVKAFTELKNELLKRTDRGPVARFQ